MRCFIVHGRVNPSAPSHKFSSPSPILDQLSFAFSLNLACPSYLRHLPQLFSFGYLLAATLVRQFTRSSVLTIQRLVLLSFFFCASAPIHFVVTVEQQCLMEEGYS